MKLSELIIKLTEATETGKFEWTEQAHEVYVCKLGNVVAVTRQYVDDDTGELGYTFAIHKNTYYAPDSTNFLDSEYGDRYSGRFTELERAYKAARRSALKLNETYDEISNLIDNRMR